MLIDANSFLGRVKDITVAGLNGFGKF